MPLIHPSAVIDPKAELDSSVEVGPFTVIDGSVRIGKGCRIGSGCRLTGDLEMGEDNILYHGAVIGEWPQHLAYDPSSVTGTRIGNRNTFREYVTVHRAYEPGRNTVIGDDNFLMCNAHVAHDCILHDKIIVVNSTLLAGHVEVYDGVVFSGNVMVHQFARVGEYCMISGGAKLRMDVPPFCTIDGDCVMMGLNVIGLRRNNFDAASRAAIKKAYKIFFDTSLLKEDAIKKMEAEFGEFAPVQRIIEFWRTSQRGVTRSSIMNLGAAE